MRCSGKHWSVFGHTASQQSVFAELSSRHRPQRRGRCPCWPCSHRRGRWRLWRHRRRRRPSTRGRWPSCGPAAFPRPNARPRSSLVRHRERCCSDVLPAGSHSPTLVRHRENCCYDGVVCFCIVAVDFVMCAFATHTPRTKGEAAKQFVRCVCGSNDGWPGETDLVLAWASSRPRTAASSRGPAAMPGTCPRKCTAPHLSSSYPPCVIKHKPRAVSTVTFQQTPTHGVRQRHSHSGRQSTPHVCRIEVHTPPHSLQKLLERVARLLVPAVVSGVVQQVVEALVEFLSGWGSPEVGGRSLAYSESRGAGCMPGRMG